MRRIRCAIYTRKSSEDGLEQDFNSLDAQREACEAYIASQKHEGWELLPDHYDDGGISGGHLDRPALQRLMQAVDDKRVDQIVVYKIDRLTRSLADFAKLVDRLDAAETSFVSVTQSFNTATSMGRLTLNMLLSFAQFEREVTAERIRDKIAASKRKGMWMGGSVPLGYQADGRTLKIDEAEATTIRMLYDLYLKHGTLREVKERAEQLDLRSRRRERAGGRISGGKHFDRGHLQHILSNPVYAGRIRHKQQVY
jgi:DNA invertase Pin-like site-specific DNA recombinase